MTTPVFVEALERMAAEYRPGEWQCGHSMTATHVAPQARAAAAVVEATEALEQKWLLAKGRLEDGFSSEGRIAYAIVDAFTDELAAILHPAPTSKKTT